MRPVTRLTRPDRAERDSFSSNRHPALSRYLGMISAQRFAFVARANRRSLFRIML
jgi:hypothetical protein